MRGLQKKTVALWAGRVLLMGLAPAGVLHAQPALDVAQLLADVEVLASDSLEGRRTGTQGSEAARAYIQAAFERIGVQPLGGTYAHPFEFSSRGDEAVSGVNLLGWVAGTERPDTVVVVTAHYDHLGVRDGDIYNGADDNASGVAGLLAVAAHFAEQPPRHSILLAALDAEEMGLRGARALVEKPPVERDAIRLNINLDMISRNAGNELYAAGTSHYPYLKPWIEAATAQRSIQLRFGHDEPGTGSADWTTASDHGPFHQAGIPFVYFGVEDHPDYHKKSDEFENIDPEFFAGAVRTIIATIVHLDRHLDDVLAGQAASGSE